jgi:hypothetical protein
MNQITDPFRYIEQLINKGWGVSAGFVVDFFYLAASERGGLHGQYILGKGDDLIHAYVDLKEKIEAWEHEQEDIDAKDEADTIQSLIVDTHQA